MARKCRLVLVALLAVAMAGAVVQAQPPGGGRGPGGRGFRPGMGFAGGGLLGLLQNSAVRNELNLSDEQIGKLVQLRDQMREQMQQRAQSFRGLRDLSEEERRQRFEQFRKEAEKRNQEVEAKIREILTAQQFKRLKQIELQQQGVRALLRADIVQALGITDEQRQKLEQIQREAGEKMRELFRGGRQMSQEERQGLREKMQQIREDLEKASMAVLTADQKAKLREIMGEPFELPRPQFPGFRRGGGPGAGGQGRGGRGQGRGAGGQGRRGGRAA